MRAHTSDQEMLIYGHTVKVKGYGGYTVFSDRQTDRQIDT